MYVQSLKLILGIGIISSLGIIFGIPEEMEQYANDIFKNSKLKFVISLFVLFFIALYVRIIFLITCHSTGEYYGNTELEPLINCVLFKRPIQALNAVLQKHKIYC